MYGACIARKRTDANQNRTHGHADCGGRAFMHLEAIRLKLRALRNSSVVAQESMAGFTYSIGGEISIDGHYNEHRVSN